MATGRRNSNTQLLEELEALSQSLYQSHTSTTRRTASLALPRTSVPAIDEVPDVKFEDNKPSSRPRARRLSLSPWRSRPKADDENDSRVQARESTQLEATAAVSTEKKGIWNWKPIRALSHIGMQKLSCLLSVEVVTAQGLPSSMNGLRLSVCIRKKETKDGAVNTMPSRVSQGAADFEETLFVRCNVYCSYGNGKQMKFEPRPFWIYLAAVDAEELDFGRNTVDLSLLIQESVQKSYEGTRVRQWDMSFGLSRKAKGGELIVKLGFQIMEKDGGTGIYNQDAGGFKSSKSKNFSSSFARKQSKTSFSVPSPRMGSRSEAWTPSQTGVTADLQGLDDLNLDEPGAPSSTVTIQKSEEAEKMEEIDLPEFDVEDKGVEIQEKQVGEEEKEPEEAFEDKSASSEVVKEMVNEHLHQTRLNELDSIAQQIIALESMMGDEKIVKVDEETESQRLDADEETVTRKFLQMLEEERSNEFKLDQSEIPLFQLEKAEVDTANESDSKVYLPDLGKGLGCVVQTRDGGYLAAMNPLDSLVSKKDTPKLAMQVSKPMLIQSDKALTGFELFQKMAAVGVEKLSSQILSSMPLDDIMGKTAEQIAFEGIASAIIEGRNKEGANSSAARTIASVKSMVNAMNTGRKERIATGIWNVNEDSLTLEEILAFSLQKIEGMAVEALKVQAEMAEEEPPFDVSALTGKTTTQDQPLASSIPLENYGSKSSETQLGNPETLTLALIVQLRDPIRRYEAVGGPILVLIHASASETKTDKNDEEKRFKVMSLHVGGLKVPNAGKRNVWDGERHRLTAMQWLVAYGLGKPGRKGKHVVSKGQETLWSLSSRVMADMWLKTMRNPDVKFPK